MPRTGRKKQISMDALRRAIQKRYIPRFGAAVPTESRRAGHERWAGILVEPGVMRSLDYYEISPKTYLDKTSFGQSIARQKEETPPHKWYDSYKKIRDAYLEGQPIDPVQWFVWNKNCEILGHEGRHRASIAQVMMKRYPALRKIPIVLACVRDFSHDDYMYKFADRSECGRCYKEFPTKLIDQKAGGGFDPRDERFRGSGYRATSERSVPRYCNECGTEMSDWDSDTCENCQAYCEECGSRIDAGSRFCRNCGTHCEDCGTGMSVTDASRKFCSWCKRHRRPTEASTKKTHSVRL